MDDEHILFEKYEYYVECNGPFENLELIFKYSEALDIDLYAQDDHGKTVLDIATINGHSKVVDLYKNYPKRQLN